MQHIIENYGVLDSGNFIALKLKVRNNLQAQKNFNIVIPYSTTIYFTHECEFDWPLLPEAVCHGHIIPGLAQQSLISVAQLCRAFYTAVVKHDSCLTLYHGHIAIYGNKCPKRGLWVAPLTFTRTDSVTTTLWSTSNRWISSILQRHK